LPRGIVFFSFAATGMQHSSILALSKPPERRRVPRHSTSKLSDNDLAAQHNKQLKFCAR